ncbi:autotransporter outer membrane beta-barrel domain-containing protein, partial [Escherichia coli]|nr:autotransporter outer membrane beta-barrel domain-containing protein [Escherichia coli]
HRALSEHKTLSVSWSHYPEGSAVRVGLGTQFSFTKNFSAYTDANYLGGGDVDQDWSANVGVKYTW